MQEAMGTVMPELQELIQAKDTPEEERQACQRDLDKLQHAGEYYAWLQRFVSGLEEGEFLAGPDCPAGSEFLNSEYSFISLVSLCTAQRCHLPIVTAFYATKREEIGNKTELIVLGTPI